MTDDTGGFGPMARRVADDLEQALAGYEPRPIVREAGVVASVGSGIAIVRGLPNVRSEELVRFDSGRRRLPLEGLHHAGGREARAGRPAG